LQWDRDDIVVDLEHKDEITQTQKRTRTNKKNKDKENKDNKDNKKWNSCQKVRVVYLWRGFNR
jgi:hypothetical protein